MDLSLFLNTAEPDPRLALVTSKTDMTRRPLPAFTLGDQLNLSVFLVDGAGNFDAASGNAAYSPWLALGLPGHDPLASQSVFTLITNGWACALSLAADPLTMYLRSAVRPALTLLLLTAHATKGPATRLAIDCPVADNLGASASTSSAQVPVAFVPRSDITALTGGLATNLDGVDDTTLPTGYTVLLSYGGVPQTFQLTADPTATVPTQTAAVPVTIRVKTWNAVTNSRYWLQLM